MVNTQWMIESKNKLKKVNFKHDSNLFIMTLPYFVRRRKEQITRIYGKKRERTLILKLLSLKKNKK